MELEITYTNTLGERRALFHILPPEQAAVVTRTNYELHHLRFSLASVLDVVTRTRRVPARIWVVAMRTNATLKPIEHCKHFVFLYAQLRLMLWVGPLLTVRTDLTTTLLFPMLCTYSLSSYQLLCSHFSLVSYESDGSVDTRPEVERTPVRP